MTDAERQAVIDAQFAKSASTTADGVSVTRRSLTELQDARAREAANAGANQNHRGIRFSKIVPGGPNG